jgi:hypothetical protein
MFSGLVAKLIVVYESENGVINGVVDECVCVGACVQSIN